MLYVQYTNPAAYPPLEHSARLLADAGWQVLFLGIAVRGAEGLRIEDSGAAIRVRQMPSWADRWPGPVRYSLYLGWVLTWLIRWRPNWVYVSDMLACPIGLLLTWVPGLRVVYHEHDAPPLGRQGRLKHLARRLLAARAQLRVLPNEPRMHHFRQTVVASGPTFSVWNCPGRDEVAPPRGVRANRELVVLYHGSIVPARLPLSVLEAIARLPDEVRLHVVGYETAGHPGYRAKLAETARWLRIEHRVELVGEVPLRSDLLGECRRCDVGLALVPAVSDDLNMRWMFGASNKPFEYLANGLAVLVSDLPGWREMFVEPGYGLPCIAEDPDSVAAALNWLLEHPRDTRAMGERGRRQIAAAWNYETQFAPVLQVLRQP